MTQKIFYLIIVSFVFQLLYSQESPKNVLKGGGNSNTNNVRKLDSLLNRNGESQTPPDSLKIFRPTIKDYIFWREGELKQSFDTALTIQNFYKQNFTQRDFFGAMPFPNIGQTFNPLEYRPAYNDFQLIPTGKSFNLINEKQVRYYDVKTPTTEFVYENGVKEGQYLSTLFTHSPNKQWNYSLRYRGLRSDGRYKRQLAANRTFVGTLRYFNKNNRYQFWSHMAFNTIENEENGGVDSAGLAAFVTNNPDYRNRDRINVNLQKAQSSYRTRRFYVGQQFGLTKKQNPQDSASYLYPLAVRNIFMYRNQDFYYEESQDETYYSSSYLPIKKKRALKEYESYSNVASLSYHSNDRFMVEGGLKFQTVRVYGDSAIQAGLISIPKEIKDTRLGVVGKMKFNWNEKLQLTANGEMTQGDLFKNAYFLNTQLDIQPGMTYALSGGINLFNQTPSLNLVYNPSFYTDFNYYNQQFRNTNTQEIFGEFNWKKYKTQVHGSFYRTQNFTYLDSDFNAKQYNNDLLYFKVGLKNHFQWRHFHTQANVQFQQVTQGENVLPLPSFIGRLSAYYQNNVFRNAAELQAGININYFSKYRSPQFFPVVNEFSLQPETQNQTIGNYPMLDAFFNLKVRRMRIYIRGENMNSLFIKGDYFSDPVTPYRDFKIQIGLFWYLFT